MGRLDDRVAFITGGARGQGRAIAAKFAAEGADIIICDVPRASPNLKYRQTTKDDLDMTAALIRSAGRRCIAEAVDVRDQSGLNALAARGVAELGGIDILVANAGISNLAPCLEMSEAVWQEMIDINLTGVWKSVRSVGSHMVERKRGSIILTSSVNSSEPLMNLTHYIASKHGVLGLMRAFAVELGVHGIRVNAIAPGVIGTEMSDSEEIREVIFGRSGAVFADAVDASHNWTALRNQSALSPMDIADAMIWFASDESRHVTGVELPVDAGHLILAGYNHNPAKDDVVPRIDYHMTHLGRPEGAVDYF